MGKYGLLFDQTKVKTKKGLYEGYITHRNPSNGNVWVEFESDSLKGWWYDPKDLIIMN